MPAMVEGDLNPSLWGTDGMDLGLEFQLSKALNVSPCTSASSLNEV